MDYIWLRLPLLLMFINGYLVYRLLVATGMAEWTVDMVLRVSAGSIHRLLLSILLCATVLSFFIPNAITVLTLLPSLKILVGRTRAADRRHVTTSVTLAAIYGANIGGMGSLVGSPANLLLIGEMDLYGVAGRFDVTFANWFLWSLPLVAMLTVMAWGVVIWGVPEGSNRTAETVPLPDFDHGRMPDKRGAVMFLLYLLFWSVEALIRPLDSRLAGVAPLICLSFFFLHVTLMLVPLPLGSRRAPMLSLRDLATGFPKKGALYLGLLILMVWTIKAARWDEQFTRIFDTLMVETRSQREIIFLLSNTVIYLTEVMSNTLVSTVFFPIAYHTAAAHHLPPMILMIIVSASSTCAFMTPVATPCNALAFGEMKGTSLGTMLIKGAVLNLVTAAIMTLWLPFILPRIYPVGS